MRRCLVRAMYLSASVVAVSTMGRYNKCSTFTFTWSGRSIGLGSADGSEAFHLSQDAQPSTAAPLAAQPPSEEEDDTSMEPDFSTAATPMDSPVRL